MIDVKKSLKGAHGIYSDNPKMNAAHSYHLRFNITLRTFTIYRNFRLEASSVQARLSSFDNKIESRIYCFQALGFFFSEKGHLKNWNLGFLSLFQPFEHLEGLDCLEGDNMPDGENSSSFISTI